MKKDLLLELAEHLDKVPADQFDMKVWGYERVSPACGTVACIAGHAVPLVDELEWMVPNSTGWLIGKNLAELTRASDIQMGMFSAHVVVRRDPDNLIGSLAFAEVFDIPTDDAREICSTDDEGTTPHEAAEMIRSYVKFRENEDYQDLIWERGEG